MNPIPPDKYKFRAVLLNLLALPCIVVWFYALTYFPSLGGWVVLALPLGYGTAFIIATGIYLLGHAMVGAMNEQTGNDDR